MVGGVVAWLLVSCVVGGCLMVWFDGVGVLVVWVLVGSRVGVLWCCRWCGCMSISRFGGFRGLVVDWCPLLTSCGCWGSEVTCPDGKRWYVIERTVSTNILLRYTLCIAYGIFCCVFRCFIILCRSISHTCTRHASRVVRDVR